jgi:hypothetical protein
MRGKFIRAAALGAAATLISFGALAQTVKVAYIDPLSDRSPTSRAGPRQFRTRGRSHQRERRSRQMKLEVVPFDNKVSPQDLKPVEARDRPGHPVHHAGQQPRSRARFQAVNRHNSTIPQGNPYLNYARSIPRSRTRSARSGISGSTRMPT